MKKHMKMISAAVALVVAIVLLVTAVISPINSQPTIERAFGVTLQDHDSSPATVTVEDVVTQAEVPPSPALALLETPEADGADLPKEIPLDENADINLVQKLVVQNLETFMAQGAETAGIISFGTRVYDDALLIQFLDFAEWLMGGSDNPVRSIVDLLYWIKDGVNGFRITLEPIYEEVSVMTLEAGAQVAAGAANSNLKEFFFHFNDNAGTAYVMATGLYFDNANWLVYGKDEKGAFAIGFDADLKNLMLYTPINGWQRNFGFCQLYDLCAPLLWMDYVTNRIQFSYGGLDWMVQIWKGQYGPGVGAEIGLYSKERLKLIKFYQCATDEQMIPMSMELYGRFGRKLLTREETLHWWLTGFVLGVTNAPDKLTMKGTLTFSDEGMADAFVKAAKKQFGKNSVTVSQDGAKVSFTW